MKEFIEDRIYKLERQRDSNLEGMIAFDEEIGSYHIRAEEQNKQIESELCFLSSLLEGYNYIRLKANED